MEYNTRLTELILKLLKQPQKLNFSAAYLEENIGNDYRNNFGKHYRKNSIELKKYHQPFEEKHGFQQDLSMLDLLFNEGPNAINYLK